MRATVAKSLRPKGCLKRVISSQSGSNPSYSVAFLRGLSLPTSLTFGLAFLPFRAPLPADQDDVMVGARLAGNTNSGMLISISLTGLSADEELVELDLRLGIEGGAAATSL